MLGYNEKKGYMPLYIIYIYIYIYIYRVGEEFTGKFQGIKKTNVRFPRLGKVLQKQSNFWPCCANPFR